MLSPKIQIALNEQINAEYWSAYLYLSMSLSAAQMSMPGLSNWLFVQWQEEQDHARVLQRYMIARETPVTLLPIASVPNEWDDALQMAREAQLHEHEISERINNLMDLATEERDFATLGRLRWFVDEQVEEEDSVRCLLNSLEMVDDDSYGRYELDQQLLRRHYRSCDAL